MTYVNLQLNPERYTGYTGPSARRIWDAVYSENCPKCKLSSKSLCSSIFVLFPPLLVALLKWEVQNEVSSAPIALMRYNKCWEPVELL